MVNTCCVACLVSSSFSVKCEVVTHLTTKKNYEKKFNLKTHTQKGGFYSPVALNTRALGFHLSASDILIGSAAISVSVCRVCACRRAWQCCTMPLQARTSQGHKNYDSMCQSQYLWKPKTLEPVHPTLTCGFAFLLLLLLLPLCLSLSLSYVF